MRPAGCDAYDEDSEGQVTHEEVREFEDDRQVFENADQGFRFGFIPQNRPESMATSDIGPEDKVDDKKKEGNVVSGISADEEYKLHCNLYAEYGNPTLEWAKQAFSWLVVGVSVWLAVTLAPVSVPLSCAFVGLATGVGIAYILRPIGS